MAALAAALSSVALPAMAQAIITQQTPLTFGRIAVAGSGGERTIVMEPDGDIILVDPGIYIIIPPEPGEYTVTGDPNTEYAISFSPNATLINGAYTNFTVDDFVADPPTIMTDGSGDGGSFTVGATITAHTGGTYGDGNYDSTFDITLTVVP